MATPTVEAGPGGDVNITVGDVDYLLMPNAENFLVDITHTGLDLIMVHLVQPGQTITRSTLRQFRQEVLERDDVTVPEFFTNVAFYGAGGEDVRMQDDAVDELRQWNVKSWDFFRNNTKARVSAGPYVAMNGMTFQPWRVYRDFNGCFMKAFRPSCTLLTLDSPQAGLGGRIIVPSRCYFNPSKERPLDGVRVSVKDNIDVAGHKTTLCNRAWEDLYPPKTEHAACVQALVDAGAIIVGKVKLQALMGREEPLECVEFAAPFNPRADGHQVPSGSSHASAAGIASYEWLDFSLGSDTNGNGRKPAHHNGCFSMRPSTGIVDTSGVVGLFKRFDMPVFFGRDMRRFPEFISAWYGKSPLLRNPSQVPVKILFPLDYLPTVNPSQSKVIDRFVNSLETALQTRKTKVSLSQLWKSDLPDGLKHSNLSQYLEKACFSPQYRDGYYALEGFRSQYERKHGKPPFVHRAMHWQWEIAKQISLDDRDMYCHRLDVYRQWLLGKIFEADSKDSLTIMVLPIEDGLPNYRDSTPPPFSPMSGYSCLNMSPIMQAPEITVIAGQVTFASVITKREEPYPIGVSVIGPPGSDAILVDLVAKGLREGDIPLRVKVGSSAH